MQTIIIANGTKEERLNKLKNTFGISFSKNDPNTLIIEKKVDDKNISIERIREILDFVKTKPIVTKRNKGIVKNIIIESAESLSIEAQNALLKLTEEPMEFVQILLCTKNLSQIINTIISRSIIMDLGLTLDFSFDKKSICTQIKTFLDVLNNSIGFRLEFIYSNKTKLTNREKSVELLNAWELLLRDLIIYEVVSLKRLKNDKKANLCIENEINNSKNFAILNLVEDKKLLNDSVVKLVAKYSVEDLISISKKLLILTKQISENNLNVILGLESFLVSF